MSWVWLGFGLALLLRLLAQGRILPICFGYVRGVGPQSYMHRLTARILLVLVLVGMFAPLALATAGPPQHACCMRKGPAQRSFSQVHQMSGNCCPPMATAQHARPGQARLRETAAIASTFPAEIESEFFPTVFRLLDYGRAPPALSFS